MENDPGAQPLRPGERPCRILLIEDDDLDFMAFHKALTQRGLSVELQRSRNAIEASEMLRLQHEEGRDASMLIVLDLNMPAMSGIQFLQELRADPLLRSVVAFAYTTSDSCADLEAAYDANVAGYFVKEVLEDSTDKLVAFLGCYLANTRLPRFGAMSGSAV